MCVLCCVCACVHFTLHTKCISTLTASTSTFHYLWSIKNRKIENSDETKPSCDGVMLRFCWSVEKEVVKFNENTEIPRSRWGHLCHEPPLSHFYSKWFTTCTQHLHALVRTSKMLVQRVVESSITTPLNHTEVILCALNYWWKFLLSMIYVLRNESHALSDMYLSSSSLLLQIQLSTAARLLRLIDNIMTCWWLLSEWDNDH